MDWQKCSGIRRSYLGIRHYTVEGLRKLYFLAIQQIGFVTLDSFEDGAILTSPSQALRWERNGVYYRLITNKTGFSNRGRECHCNNNCWRQHFYIHGNNITRRKRSGGTVCEVKSKAAP